MAMFMKKQDNTFVPEAMRSTSPCPRTLPLTEEEMQQALIEIHEEFESEMSTTSLEDALSFFKGKFNVDNEHGDKGSNMEDCEACVNHVEKYGLTYEVFVLAYDNIDDKEKASFDKCSQVIGIQYDEWDL